MGYQSCRQILSLGAYKPLLLEKTMAMKPSAEKVKSSRAYERAKSKASEYANDPEKLKGLIGDATKKAESNKGPLKEVWDTLMAFFRLLHAYSQGHYREVPTLSLIMIIVSIIYFLSPVDLIPDFIPVAGYLDDAALLGWTMKTVKSDIDNFMSWEQRTI
jgi:uncharacterized membrane protein YkvA (DUF1232 family)